MVILMNKMNKLFVIVLLALISFNASAKDNYRYKNIDSLKIVIHNMINVDGKMHRSDSAIKLVVRNRKLFKSEFGSYLLLLKHKIEEDNDSISLPEIYYRLGVNHRYKHRYDSAKFYYKKALPLAEIKKDYYQIGRIYNELGVVCRKTDQNNEAINYFLESIKSTKYSNNYYGKAIAENGVGNIYLVQREYEKALYYFRESIKYGFKNNNSFHQELCYGNLGETYMYLNQSDSAKYYINKCLELAVKRKYPMSQGICYMLLGQVEMNQKQYHKAYEHFEKSLVIQRDIKDKRYLSSILIHHGSAAEKLNKNLEAEKNLLEGRAISKEIHSIDHLIFSNQALYELYYKTKRYQEACDALMLTKNYTDSLYNSEKLRVTNDLEFKYQSEQKTQQIELLNARNQLIGESKKMQRNQLGVLILLFGGLAAFFYFRYQTKQRVTHELRNINKMKSKFFSNISHEFRTPLTLIKGPIEKQLRTVKNETKREDLELVLRNSNRMLSLVDQLLNISKIDAGHFAISAQEGDLSTLLKGISNSFNFQANEKLIEYKTEICETGLVWFDHNIVEIVVTNILSNAFKFVPTKGKVGISAIIFNKKLKIIITNSGCNLTKQELTHVFDRFYRGGDSEIQGTGIGLSLVKELCKLYRTDIRVFLSSDHVICFEIDLPIIKEHFKHKEISEISTKQEKPFNIQGMAIEADSTEEIGNDEMPILLIVEDNSDMRKYIKSCFKFDYKILEAEDGEFGIQLAQKFIPDIIISDVMMPNVGGVELCNRLRSDEKTNHIPIILLTAKVGEENTLEGLKSGADDYITKPFNAEALLIKVERLVANRKAIQDKYQKELIINPLNLVFESEEEKFARSLQNILEKHLSDPDFSVEQFCELTSMSRTQLHRKLKAVTGLSATAFIRAQRIKMASEILLQPNVSVSEACFSTGFNDTSYFSKCFKEIHGCTPTEYLRQHSN